MQKYFSKFAAFAALSVALSATAVQAEELKKVTGLKTPESVIADKKGHIFISEIGEFGKDGDGQISVVGKDGKLSVFAKGLDDPKGLAIIGDDLYVADNHRIIKITPNGKWQVFVAASAFPEQPQFLNDLERDLAGKYLYVSDSGDLKGKGGAIYRISLDGKVTTVINQAGDARVQGPNGLLMDDTGEVLTYVDFVSGILYTLNFKSGKLTDVAEGFGGGDGVVHHPNGLIYVSDWKNGKVFSVHHDQVKLIKDGFKAAADIALSADGKYILVPDMTAGELIWLPLK
ncbi:MAG: gluconolaconase [Methylophilaceae bacterium]|nr:gluconolaconase [Methylophilaceae bacterium]